MTIKELFPNLSDEHRILIGIRFITCYRSLYKADTEKIQEGDYKVFNYPDEFITKRMVKLKNRFQKAFPAVDLRQPEKPKSKRARISASRVNIKK